MGSQVRKRVSMITSEVGILIVEDEGCSDKH